MDAPPVPRDGMLVGVWKDALIARLGPEESDEAIEEPHAKELEP